MAGYVPDADGDFDSWQGNWMTYAGANLAALGISATRFAELVALQLAWRTRYDNLGVITAQKEAATQFKVQARDPFQTALQDESQIVQKRSSTTNDQRAGLQITVPDTTRTPVPPPTTAPVGRIETPSVRKHTVHFADSTTPTSKKKPDGVRGCQILMKIGAPPPTSASEMEFVVTDPKTPHDISFEVADVGKTVYYWLRWENTRGEPGPWSAMISATITG